MWVVLAWSKDSGLGPAEIAPFVRLVLFKDEGGGGSPVCQFFVSDVNHWNEEAG